MLLLVDGITFIWVDTFTVYPFHSTFQIFLASLMFLAAYDPLRGSISWLANRTLNVRGQQLAEAIEHLQRRVPAVITADALTRELLDPLHASGRVPNCSVYLWDPRLAAFRVVVCLPLDAPVNNDRDWPNWGPAEGDFASLAACKAALPWACNFTRTDNHFISGHNTKRASWPVAVPRNTWLQRKRCGCTATAWMLIAAQCSAIPRQGTSSRATGSRGRKCSGATRRT